MDKVTIIGGSGFIGSRLCALLAKEQIDFVIIDKNPSHFFPDKVLLVDIRNKEKLEEILPESDCVINLAAEHRDDVTPKSLYDEVNVEGSRNIISACKKKGINHIIFTSSVAVYGFAPPNTDEQGEIHYFNDYGRTKWEAEVLYRKWYDEDTQNRILTIIRPTVVFGERNRGNVYNFLHQIAKGYFMMVGSGKNYKSMAYVENVASFIKYMIFNGKGYQLYNYIDKPDLTMNDLVSIVKEKMGKKVNTGIHLPYWLGYFGGLIFDLLSKITGKKFPISSIRVKKFCATTQFETSINEKTTFIPPISLEEGLKRTIEFEFLKKAEKESIVFYSE